MIRYYSSTLDMAVKPIGEIPFYLPVRLDAAPSKQDNLGEHVSRLFGIEADGEATATAVETVARDVVVINSLSHIVCVLNRLIISVRSVGRAHAFSQCAHTCQQPGRHPETREKNAILEYGNMLDRPTVKCIVDKIVAGVLAFELAAHWPPVELLLELDANTIHNSNSFPCS